MWCSSKPILSLVLVSLLLPAALGFNASQGKQLPQLVSRNQYTRVKPVHILDQRPAMQCTETVYLQVQELHPDDPIAQKSISRLQPIVAERQEKMKDEMLGAPLVLLLNAVLQVLTWQRWILLPECVLIAALAPQVVQQSSPSLGRAVTS